MANKRWTKHTVTLGVVVAGLATEVFCALRETRAELIASEGLASLLGAPGVGSQLEKLAAEVRSRHSPEALEAVAAPALPIDPGAVFEDSKGFLRRTALSKAE